MFAHTSRRRFLQGATAASALAGMSQLGFLGRLPAVSAEEAQPDPKVVRLSPDIEPLVRVIEETPREKLLEEVAGRIQSGTSYREVVAALLLAGVRRVDHQHRMKLEADAGPRLDIAHPGQEPVSYTHLTLPTNSRV